MTWHDVEQSLGEWGAEHELMAVFGDTLRQARAYKGVTLREAERATRINRYHLAALEEENFPALPPLIYQRGIVRNYATYLELDANKLLSMFDEARGGGEQPDVNVVVKPLDMPSHWAPNFAIIAFMVVMSAIVFAWLYSAYFAPTGASSTPAEVIATVTPVESEALFIPSPTPVPPTPTPLPTATPTEEPTSTPTEEPAEVVTEQVLSTEPVEEDPVEPEVTQEETEEATGSYTFTFVADTDVYLELVVDGNLAYQDYIGAGAAVGPFSGDLFEIYTDNPAQLRIDRDNGESFYMGDSYFALP